MDKKRLSRAQKEANDFAWFKEQIDLYDRSSFSSSRFDGQDGIVSEWRKMKINYDLFNNRINAKDFEYVCQPYGESVGKLPLDFTNKDILSGKIKAMLGMEMRRPFSWKVVAVNEEATTRREQEEFEQIKQFVINSITAPIRQQLELEQMQQAQGRELTEEEKQQMQQQIEEEMKTRTPPEVGLYMEREHQDPAEILSHQILEYLMEEQNIREKFNRAWKHGLISGKEIFWVGEVNGKPMVKVINPLRFDYDRNSDNHYIEEGEWGCYEMYLTPSQIISHFGDELTEKQIDDIYSNFQEGAVVNSEFTFRDEYFEAYGVRVIHCEWKAPKAVKFVSGVDLETGEPYEFLVDETYQINREAGDLEVIKKWIPSKFEGYKIGKDIYVGMREVPGQNKDLDNLYNCRLSYIGACYDNMNSESTSLVDRMKYYQYMYNILMYKIELLISSDEGKTLLLDGSIIPKSAGIKTEEWIYDFKVNKLGIVNSNEEGSRYNDITQSVKEIDLSLMSDIQKYIELAEYVERRCGESVGITKQIEGQIGGNEAVRNTQQAIIQSANILEPYFEVHSIVKKNVLQSLIEVAKVAYLTYQPSHLNYVLDDMSRKMVTMDYDLLENSTYGVFVNNSTKADEALQMVQQLSHAAMQNQTIEMSDLIKVMRSQSIPEAEELLKRAEKERREFMQQQQQQEQQAQQELQQAQQQFEKDLKYMEHQFKMEEIEKKGELDIQKQAILSIGFNEDKDLDKDGVPDVLEVAKFGVDANVKAENIKLQREKLDYQKEKDRKQEKLMERKLDIEDKKAQSQVLKAKVSAN
jgi:hypothetical protein